MHPSDEMWNLFNIPPTTMFAEVYTDDDVELVELPQSCVMGRHDCMWAGTCSSEMHKKLEYQPPVVPLTLTPVVPIKSSRSVLRTSRNRTRSRSPRPETPSESEEDECMSTCDSEDFSMAVSLSEVTGQISRTSVGDVCVASSPPPPAIHTDHSYHLSKTTVTLDNLGVQTPSDSEEEIDVVSVVDREKLTTLPTNPSAKDKQQLQQTVACAIQHRRGRSRNRRRAVSEDGRPPKRRRYYRAVEDTSDKRHQHNNMERLRRIDLRDSISRLRASVPHVARNERAPKVLVLKEATKFIIYLTQAERKLSRKAAELRATQEILTSNVKRLRTENAIGRGCVIADPIPSTSGASYKRKRPLCEDPEPPKRKPGGEGMIQPYRKKRKQQ